MLGIKKRKNQIKTKCQVKKMSVKNKEGAVYLRSDCQSEMVYLFEALFYARHVLIRIPILSLHDKEWENIAKKNETAQVTDLQ